MALSTPVGIPSLLSLPFPPLANFKDACAGFKTKLNLVNTTIFTTEHLLPNATVVVPGQISTCAGPGSPSVEVCRVTGYTKTSDRSGVNWETWLPKNWTGRFMSHGNGGLSGCIVYSDLVYTTSLGFAAVSGNSGHNGTSGEAFLNNSDTVADFVWRSVHAGVVVGKQITKNFYSKPHTKSYYLGCSTGGRQGFKAVQDWPEDFDGVVAGAPATDFNDLNSWSGSFYLITGPVGSPGFIPAATWPAIDKDVFKQCDGLDGSVDGIVEDPSICKYDPSGLLCQIGNANTTECLTKEQVESVRKIYSPLLQKDGSMIYPRLEPGSGYPGMTLNGQPFQYTQDWYRYAIFNNASWNAGTLTLNDMAYAAKKDPEGASTWKADLSAFQKRGSKVIHYHGHADVVITATNSARYYNRVLETMKATPSQLDAFYRYFHIGGMGHCGGGPGAHEIGARSRPPGSASLDPSENVVLAMIQWVERGVAPETLTGVKYKGDSKANGVQFKRRHCKYPARAKYSGQGDANVADNWQCVL